MLDETISYSIYSSDKDAWPSSYYRKTARIDLAKFYQDILKKSTQEEGQIQIQSKNNSDSSKKNNNRKVRKVTFSTEPPQIYEYEPEFDSTPLDTTVGFMSEGWPGRANDAMNTSSFIDFKSKIEAKLGAVNDPSLMTELNNNMMKEQESRGFYRLKKDPLVQKLKLRPIPNENFDVPSLVMDTTPSPSSSCSDSPGTPMDGFPLPILENFSQSASISSSSSCSTTSSSSGSLKSPTKVAWLKTFSLLRSTAARSK